MEHWSNHNRIKSGFTLVEMLVAVAIFTIVVLVMIAAMLSVNEAIKKSHAIRAVVDNLNLAMESMSRRIRSGTNYHCDIGPGVGNVLERQDCDNGTVFAFLPFGKDRTNPAAQDFTVYRYNPTSQRIEVSYGGPNGNFLNITAPEVQIQDLKFRVRGAGAYPSDQEQPRVIITVRGEANIRDRANSAFTLETMVSQFLLDVE